MAVIVRRERCGNFENLAATTVAFPIPFTFEQKLCSAALRKKLRGRLHAVTTVATKFSCATTTLREKFFAPRHKRRGALTTCPEG